MTFERSFPAYQMGARGYEADDNTPWPEALIIVVQEQVDGTLRNLAAVLPDEYTLPGEVHWLNKSASRR